MMENKLEDIESEKINNQENGCDHNTTSLIKREELDSETNHKDIDGCNHNTKLLTKENGHRKEDDQIEFEKRPTSAERWKKAKDDIIQNKMTWKWMLDEVTDEIDSVPQDDGCCKWIKRFLTIGNISVIMACFCLLIASFVVCFKK